MSLQCFGREHEGSPQGRDDHAVLYHAAPGGSPPADPAHSGAGRRVLTEIAGAASGIATEAVELAERGNCNLRGDDFAAARGRRAGPA